MLQYLGEGDPPSLIFNCELFDEDVLLPFCAVEIKEITNQV